MESLRTTHFFHLAVLLLVLAVTPKLATAQHPPGPGQFWSEPFSGQQPFGQLQGQNKPSQPTPYGPPHLAPPQPQFGGPQPQFPAQFPPPHFGGGQFGGRNSAPASASSANARSAAAAAAAAQNMNMHQ